MSSSYLADAMRIDGSSSSDVPQSEPLPGRGDMLQNSAGGFVFKASNQAKLERFLVLGTEKGTFYASEKQLTREAAANLQAMVQGGQAAKVVDTVVDFSVRGLTPKQDTLIFALAMVIKLAPAAEDRTKAYQAIAKVCRIPTTLFGLVEFEKLFSSTKKPTWGAGMRKAIAKWYTTRSPTELAFTCTKYRSRNDWTHRDMLRVSHVRVGDGYLPEPPSASEGEEGQKAEADSAEEVAQPPAKKIRLLPPITNARELVFRYLVRGRESVQADLDRLLADATPQEETVSAEPVAMEEEEEFELVPRPQPESSDGHTEMVRVATFLAALEELADLGKKSGTPSEQDLERATQLIRRHRLAREHVPTGLLNMAPVWKALLDIGMPMTAMIRNLGKMSSVGLLRPLSAEVDRIVSALSSRDALRKARVHPFSILLALETYRSGQGVRGSLSWDADAQIVDALASAFDLAFENVEPTGKRYMIGLDVSGSMGSPIAGSTISSRTAASAVASILVRSEQHVHTMAFCDTFVDFPIGKSERLDSIVERSDNLPFGGTDCALPMLYALEKRIEVDVFLVMTDNETWFGEIHPSAALQRYRQAINPRAKLAVAAFAVNDFSIADPEDFGMLDIVGLNAALPTVLRDFALRDI